MVQFRVYLTGPHEGLKYCRVYFHKKDKTTKFGLKTPVLGKEVPYIDFIDNPGNPYSGYKIMEYIRKVSPPEQKRVFCYAATREQIVDYRKTGKPYLTNPHSPYGHNAIGGFMNYIANLAGFEDWERFTNHAARALGITMAVSKNDAPSDNTIKNVTRHKKDGSDNNGKKGGAFDGYIHMNPQLWARTVEAVQGEWLMSMFPLPPCNKRNHLPSAPDDHDKPDDGFMESKPKPVVNPYTKNVKPKPLLCDAPVASKRKEPPLQRSSSWTTPHQKKVANRL
jgi:hypothetical protein